MKGNKYELVKDLDLKDIAKLIRKDIKHFFPELDYSVTIQRFSLGGSITIKTEVVGVDEQTKRELRQVLLDIGLQYNIDESDSMTDHIFNNFFLHVKVK